MFLPRSNAGLALLADIARATFTMVKSYIHLARKYCHLAHYRGAKQHLCHAEHPAEGWAFQLQFEGPCKLCHTQQRLKQQSRGQVEVAAFCVNIFVSCY